MPEGIWYSFLIMKTLDSAFIDFAFLSSRPWTFALFISRYNFIIRYIGRTNLAILFLSFPYLPKSFPRLPYCVAVSRILLHSPLSCQLPIPLFSTFFYPFFYFFAFFFTFFFTFSFFSALSFFFFFFFLSSYGSLHFDSINRYDRNIVCYYFLSLPKKNTKFGTSVSARHISKLFAKKAWVLRILKSIRVLH